MMEPDRLLTAGSPVARSLLRRAKRDAPPASLVPALVASLGVATAGSSIGAKVAAAVRHAALSKITVAIVAVAAASGGAYALRGTHDHVVRTEVVQPRLEQRSRRVSLVGEPVAPAPPPAAAVASSPPVQRPARKHPVVPTAPPSIVGELDEIRHARTLVVSGDGKRALDALDAYAASHPQGTFEEEALVLRIRALRLTGDRVGAERSLQALETRFPKSVYLPSTER